MTWGKVVLDEAEHDLAYLDPFTLSVRPSAEEAPDYRVRISFSHHVFTRKLVNGDDQSRHFGPPNDVRCICDQRLPLSRELPDIIGRAVNGKAFFPSQHHKRQRNFLFVETAGDPYLIAFNLSRAKIVDADAMMFVVSAHMRPDFKRKNHETIRFATLVSKTVRGEPIVRPPYRR